tara:strand:- start:923 stop:1117 length:195 start_codon:yes stop_codon:yes gene_type:complete
MALPLAGVSLDSLNTLLLPRLFGFAASTSEEGDEEGLFVMAVDVEEGADDDSPELRVDVELARG